MTDRELAQAVTGAADLERLARAQWERSQSVASEREAALEVMRLAIPLRRKLEGWITQRACRAVAQA